MICRLLLEKMFEFTARLSPIFLGRGIVARDFLRPAEPKAQFAIEVTQGRVRSSEDFCEPSNGLCRTTLENGLINLSFDWYHIACGWTQRSKDRRGTRQIALGLRNRSSRRNRVE